MFIYFDLVIPLPGTCPRNRIVKKKKIICNNMFKAQKNWELTKCPIIEEWSNKI